MQKWVVVKEVKRVNGDRNEGFETMDFTDPEW
jgi:hypothetical protein